MYIARWLPAPNPSDSPPNLPPYLSPDSVVLAYGNTSIRTQATETDYKNTDLCMKPENGANITSSNSNLQKARLSKESNSSGEQPSTMRKGLYMRSGEVVVAPLNGNSPFGAQGKIHGSQAPIYYNTSRANPATEIRPSPPFNPPFPFASEQPARKTKKCNLNHNAKKFKLGYLDKDQIRYDVIYKNLVRDVRKYYLQDFNATYDLAKIKKDKNSLLRQHLRNYILQFVTQDQMAIMGVTMP